MGVVNEVEWTWTVEIRKAGLLAAGEACRYILTYSRRRRRNLLQVLVLSRSSATLIFAPVAYIPNRRMNEVEVLLQTKNEGKGILFFAPIGFFFGDLLKLKKVTIPGSNGVIIDTAEASLTSLHGHLVLLKVCTLCQSQCCSQGRLAAQQVNQSGESRLAQVHDNASHDRFWS